ncbi:hypothetical protein ACWG8W_01010 [Citricoccus zhacaiensis]|nr:transposase [Cellulosimicrobium funkei]
MPAERRSAARITIRAPTPDVRVLGVPPFTHVGCGCVRWWILERDDQIAHRRNRPGRPVDFGEQQRARYRGRHVVERCFNRLKQWRGIALRSDKTAGS